jgi:anti-sigma regulatory factor (Ser/Thr protein kinase)
MAVAEFVRSHTAIGDELLSDITLCVSEAAGNVVIHAYGDVEGDIALAVRLTRAHLIVEIRDEGPGSGTHERRPGLGLGMPIVHALSDATIRTDQAGRQVTMRFPLGPGTEEHGAPRAES